MDAWWKAVISWIPFLLLIGFWFYFMKKMKPSRQGQLIERSVEHMARVETLLEQIAASVERRPSSS